jgi:hypothetical protein
MQGGRVPKLPIRAVEADSWLLRDIAAVGNTKQIIEASQLRRIAHLGVELVDSFRQLAKCKSILAATGATVICPIVRPEKTVKRHEDTTPQGRRIKNSTKLIGK